MTREDALSLADRILSLVNAQPKTPTREEIADAIFNNLQWTGPDGRVYYSAKAHAEIERECRETDLEYSLRLANVCWPNRRTSEDGDVELTGDEAAAVRDMLSSGRGILKTTHVEESDFSLPVATLPAGTVVTDEVLKDMAAKAGEALKRDAQKAQEAWVLTWSQTPEETTNWKPDTMGGAVLMEKFEPRRSISEDGLACIFGVVSDPAHPGQVVGYCATHNKPSSYCREEFNHRIAPADFGWPQTKDAFKHIIALMEAQSEISLCMRPEAFAMLPEGVRAQFYEIRDPDGTTRYRLDTGS